MQFHAEIERLHQGLIDRPYDVCNRLELVDVYEKLGYADLACAEAYRTVLLIDEIVDDSAEFHDVALAALLEANEIDEPADNEAARQAILEQARSEWQIKAYKKLVQNLLECGCIKDAVEFYLRASKIFPVAEWEGFEKLIQKAAERYLERDVKVGDLSSDDMERLSSVKVYVRRELYAWNHHEPDRFGTTALSWLNEQMKRIAPDLEVCVTELPLLTESSTSEQAAEPVTVKQLGVFSKRDISPGEIVLDEKSILTAQSRLHDAFCDACSAPLPDLLTASDTLNGDDVPAIVGCDDCDAVFCSEDCHDLAMSGYHPAICDTGVEVAASDATAVESADALYSLLLLRALAMSQTQEIHPLDLTEVKYIWGDYLEPDTRGANDPKSYTRSLPFSFKYHVLLPLQILEKMDVNILEESAKYDFWVFNTLYAKFRGTASARQGLDGKPEIAAVHPFWCLANHSCDPNVAWDWRGSMKFTARPQRVLWEGKDSPLPSGIARGQEIFGHYCDIELPVTERREWAAGALGGECMCDRCMWEATLPDHTASD